MATSEAIDIPLREQQYGEDEGTKDDDPKPSRAFSTTIGAVCTCIGAAVGTGNMWRFSRIVAQSSGSEGALCFLLVWFMFLFLWSMPMLLIEYGLGRYTKKGITLTFMQILGPWSVWGAGWVTFVTFAIVSFYTVVVGWCIYYFFYTMIHPLPLDYIEASQTFYNMAESWPAVLTQFAALSCSGLILLKNVSSIEKANLVLSPLLLFTLLGICIWSLTREHALEGVRFMFTPDWKTLKEPKVWINAVSQNAFDTSAGEGTFIAYAAYMTRKTPVTKYAAGIPTINNMVSLICGMTTFATGFSSTLKTQPNATDADVLTILQESGPGSTGITFIWMPVLFSSFGVLGRVIGSMFFFCLAIAGISSNIGYMETCVRSLEDLGVKRKFAVPGLTIAAFLVGIPSALSSTFLDSQDITWGYALLTTGLMILILVIVYGAQKFRTVILNDYGLRDWYMPKAYGWFINFVAPVEAVALIVWWVVQNITSSGKDGGKRWYEPGTGTLITVIFQWVIVVTAIFLLNVLVMRLKPKWWMKLLSSTPARDGSVRDTAMNVTLGPEDGNQPNGVSAKLDINNEAAMVEDGGVDGAVAP